MSDFLKRWSLRKRQAEQGQATPCINQSLADEVLAKQPSSDGLPHGEVTLHDELTVGSVSASVAAKGQSAAAVRCTLPSKEVLQALFKQQIPDGLDDYNQDFSQPEPLTAALSAGLRQWLSESEQGHDGQVQGGDSQRQNSGSQSQEEPADEAVLANNLNGVASKNSDILSQGVRQNVLVVANPDKLLGS